MKRLEKLKLKKLDISVLILVLILLFSIAIYYYYQKIKTQQKIQQLQLELQKIDKDLERAKKFNEEEYAEKISKVLDLESYFSTSTDIEVEGVETIKKRDRKLVINHKEGYQIEIPGNLILNQSRSARGLNFDDPERIEMGLPKSWWGVIFITPLDPVKDADYLKRIESQASTSNYKIITNDNLELIRFETEFKSEFYGLSTKNYNYFLKSNSNLGKYFLIEIVGGIKGYKFEQIEEYIKTFKLIKNE
jgi:hypothetical protein